jgi:hypothetical protein
MRLAAPLSVFIFGMSAISLLVVSRSGPEQTRSSPVPAVLLSIRLDRPLQAPLLPLLLVLLVLKWLPRVLVLPRVFRLPLVPPMLEPLELPRSPPWLVLLD